MCIREISPGFSGNINKVLPVDRNSIPLVIEVTAQVGGKDQVAGFVELGDKNIVIHHAGFDLDLGLQGIHNRKIFRFRIPGHDGIARPVHRYAPDFVGIFAAEVG